LAYTAAEPFECMLARLTNRGEAALGMDRWTPGGHPPRPLPALGLEPVWPPAPFRRWLMRRCSASPCKVTTPA